MKKVLFFALFLIFLGAASVNAQVTIGKNEAPHPASVLDLRSTDKGLLLPKVNISDANAFQLSTGREDEAIGLTVYNTNKAMLNGQGAGIYAWSGSKWMIVSADGGGTAIPVMIITVSSPNSSVASGAKEQFSVDVQPGNATNPNYTWSIFSGGGTSSITPEGLFTAGSPGDLTVRATAADGSGIYGEKRITVDPPTVPITRVFFYYTGELLSGACTLEMRSGSFFTIEPSNATNKTLIWSVESETQRGIVTVDQKGVATATNVGSGTAVIRATSASNPSIFAVFELYVYAIAVGPPGPGTVTGANGTYKTYCFPGTVGCWMIENSKEGTPSSTTYSGKSEGERGFYYGNVRDDSVCPEGWIIPPFTAAGALVRFLESDETPQWYRDTWLGYGHAGYYTQIVGGYRWSGWGQQSAFLQGEKAPGSLNRWVFPRPRSEVPVEASVRCIRSK